MYDLNSITEYLKNYDGDKIKIMEICGTHTSAIARNGIRGILSPKIELVSGPGCPVCVTVSSYIDRLCELSMKEGYCVASFGDMLRVMGRDSSLNDAKANGGNVIMLYSPLDLLKIAQEHPETTYVFAAVGFETTAPVYALLLERAYGNNIKNIKLLTALKTMPPVLSWLCAQDHDLSGFIAPGHVSVVTGIDIYKPFAQKYNLPFVVTGFDSEQILKSIYILLNKIGSGEVINIYTTVVRPQGNENAREIVDKYFEPKDATWRGLGNVPDSGMYLRQEYIDFDADSFDLSEDVASNKNCRCGELLMGRITPKQCPLFGKACTPEKPMGACMVSGEGACRIWFETNTGDGSMC